MNEEEYADAWSDLARWIVEMEEEFEQQAEAAE